jgi:hypothetical protein
MISIILFGLGAGIGGAAGDPVHITFQQVVFSRMGDPMNSLKVVAIRMSAALNASPSI